MTLTRSIWTPLLALDRLNSWLRAPEPSWCANNLPRQRFDCAWHDLWSDPDRNEPHLALIHSELFVRCHNAVSFQGAWAFPKPQKTIWRRTVGNIIA